MISTPRTYTITIDRRIPFSADHPDALDHGGLDLYLPMFAPCLLGCPGTPRQHPVSAARCRYRRPDKMAAPGTCRHRPIPGQRGRLEQSSGLLIRGFGVQVPGGAPVLTWGLSLHVLFYVPVLSPCWLRARS